MVSSLASSTFRVSYTGSLPARLFRMAGPAIERPIQVHYNGASVIEHIQEAKPDIFVVDCTHLPSSCELLSQISAIPLNGTAFMGATLIDRSAQSTMARFYEIKDRLSAFGAVSADGYSPILNDILEVSGLEELHENNPGSAQNSILTSMKRAVELSRSRQDILTDRLTGLPSEKAFGLILNEEIKRSLRSGSETAVIFGDLRRFKELNDTFGHTLADQVLIRFAEIFRSSLRQSDVVARPHGDEFCFMLPGTGKTGTEISVRNIIKAVTAEPSPFCDIHPDIKPGVNLGAIVFNMGGHEQSATLYRMAQEYFESMGKKFESDLLGAFLIDTADKLSYISRAKGENHFETGTSDTIPQIQASFAKMTESGRRR